MTPEEMEKRLKALEDIEEIKQLHRNYIILLNQQKFEEMLDCFAEDAIVEGLMGANILVGGKPKYEGKEEIAWAFRSDAKRQREIKLWKGGQILVHPIISVEGDMAKGCWTWYRVQGSRIKWTSQFGQELIMQTPREARYDMEYKRIDGKWKMWRLKFTEPWPATADQWPK